jgi:hypothetical protein
MAAPTVPDWGVRTPSAVSDELGAIAVARLAGQPRHEAMLTAMSWALYEGRAPISGVDLPATEHNTRVECDGALFVAHCGHAPRAEQWTSLGHPNPPRVAAGDTAEWGYGVWRVLAWLLGDCAAVPPTEDTSRWPRLPQAQRQEIGSAVAARWG